ncbi:GNAT family N-acetyltransferase [Indioceanicola profundi]|uniref:GNAT family N-acetyltransferase n=1 Tax=Indioceanicola profundi TaxID=2220096 RepID=UPI0013C42201|nr:GNAT family N-acetyltransferase [Indioceanicola profundi]
MFGAPDRFNTERIAAARLTRRDEEVILSMHNDPVVMASIGGVQDRAMTENYMRLNLEHWQRRGFGIYLLHGRLDGALLGRAGIRTTKVQGAEEVELSYVLMPGAWGRGLATEAARALVALARDVLSLPGLVAFIAAANAPSQRVAGKCGFIRQGVVERSTGPHELHRLVF